MQRGLTRAPAPARFANRLLLSGLRIKNELLRARHTSSQVRFPRVKEAPGVGTLGHSPAQGAFTIQGRHGHQRLGAANGSCARTRQPRAGAGASAGLAFPMREEKVPCTCHNLLAVIVHRLQPPWREANPLGCAARVQQPVPKWAAPCGCCRGQNLENQTASPAVGPHAPLRSRLGSLRPAARRNNR